MAQRLGKEIYITKVASSIGKSVCQALIGMHAFTGCDTVNAFTGKGKAKALKMLMHNREDQDTFLKLGQEWDMSSGLMDKLETFTWLPKHHPLKSMTLDITCSVLSKVRLRVISFHHEEIV